jgi:tRNA U38,U39,U40 pseudouridine synthase TruA
MDNSNDPKKVDVQRSARTDAGVHAAGNVSVRHSIVSSLIFGEDVDSMLM